MITVACCLWGQWPGNHGRGGDYVMRLRAAVARNLPVPHRFVCFADDIARVPAGIEARPLLAPSWLGCLPKVFVYSPAAGLDGRILLFDLDNIVVGSLDDMAAYDGDLCVRGTFDDPAVPDGDMISFRANSAAAIRLWREMSENPARAESETGGRERVFIRNRVMPDLWQSIIPGQVVSYKHHCRMGLPAGARIVSCHGRPRPHELTHHDWVRRHWCGEMEAAA